MMIARLAATIALAATAAVCAAACSSNEEDESARCLEEPIEQFKEMIIVDEGVLADARTKNATSGPWSFRHAIENMAPEGVDGGEFVKRWFTSWVMTREINGYKTDKPTEERDGEMQRLIVCPWLKRTADNACNDDCSACAAQKLDLALAPFRLIAISNRLDQRDEVASEPNGESRLVFALTDGAADDPQSSPRAMSVIFEYANPSSRTAQDWAKSYHELGKFDSFDEPYRAALEELTNSFTKRGAEPSKPNGSAIGQVRTNESVLNWIWQQREFGLDKTGMLVIRPVRNTPGETLNNTETLRKYILDNQDAILANRYEMPERMRAGSADQLLYAWAVPDIDPKLRRAFAAGTCNGCHSSENPNIDTAFHVSPFRQGTAKLSPYLYSPGQDDELTRRMHLAARVRCTGQ